MATINEALKSLILALGGDPESMYDNTTISDYIKDLETAMQASGSGVKIDDTTASDSTVYSSSKTESLIPVIPDPELPSVTSEDIGEALIVESDGEGGAQWGKGAISQNVAIFSGRITSSYPDEVMTFNNGVKLSDITDAIRAGKYVIIFVEGKSPLLLAVADLLNNYAVFESFYQEGTTFSVYDFTDSFTTSQSATSVTLNHRTKYFLPTVNASDNDKILKVVNGVWTAVTP